MDKHLKNFMEQLSSEKVGQIVAFSTTGATNNTNRQIRKIATIKGISVHTKELLVKMLWHGHACLGLKGGTLTDKQKKMVQNFAKTIEV